jgi:RHS repeat-associated protein
MGNILMHSAPSETVAYTYNKAHQIVSAGDETFEYDHSGNLIQKKDKNGTFKYQYDALNRLSDAILPDGSKISYRYDPSGRLIMTDNRGEKSRVIYDGNYPLLKTGKNAAPVSSFVYGPGFYELLGEEKGGKKQFFTANNLGSIVAVTNEAGEVIARIDYTSFGKPILTSGEMPPAAFGGVPYQPETGLLLFKYRAYDPVHARFLQSEPLGLMVAWQNSYSFASNNPVNMIDLYGLLSFYQWVGAATVAVGVAAVAVMAAPAILTAVGATALAASATAVSTAVVTTAASVATTVGLTTAAGAVTTTGLVAGGAATGAAIISGTITAINTEGSTGDRILAGIGAATIGAGAAVTATVVGVAGGGAWAGFTNGTINAAGSIAENVSRGDPVNPISTAIGVAASTATGGLGGNIFDGGSAATQINGIVFGAAADSAQMGATAVATSQCN